MATVYYGDYPVHPLDGARLVQATPPDPTRYGERTFPQPPTPAPLPTLAQTLERQFGRWLVADTRETLDEYIGWSCRDETAA